jgi:hypothetical protein
MPLGFFEEKETNMEDANKQHQLNIELAEKEAEGIYSNLAIITHSTAEFVIDFTRILPGVPKAKVFSRIIMTPQHAKLLAAALKENIQKYESKFGEIKVIGNPNDIANSPFPDVPKFH